MNYFFANKIWRKAVLCSFFLFLLSSFAFAATIHGNVYDDSLQKINGALITVNSIPKQTYISQQGTYSFELPRGEYVLNATYKEFANIQTIQIDAEGDYVIDLILFSEIVEEDLESSLDLFTFNETRKGNEKQTILFFGMGIVLLLILGIFFFFFKKKARKNELEIFDSKEPKDREIKEEVDSDELEHILKIIAKFGSRTTQKDIRKEIPLSEAKISLMLTQLEAEGKIKKIKKGRGNVIILTSR